MQRGEIIVWRSLLAGVALSLLAEAVRAQPAVQRRAWRVSPTASIKIHAPSGELVVQGWAYDSVSISGTLATGESLFGGGSLTGIKLGAEGSATAGRTALLVRVPATARLVVRSGAANVEVIGLTSTIDVGSAAGNVDVSGETEAVIAESISGDVHVAVNAPSVRARTTRGRLEIAGAIREAQLSSVSGRVDVSGVPLGTLRIETVEGDVTIRGRFARTASVDVETFGGAVDLRVQQSQRVALDLRATDGTIRSTVRDASGAGSGARLEDAVVRKGTTMSLMRTIGTGNGPPAPVTIRTLRGRISISTELRRGPE